VCFLSFWINSPVLAEWTPRYPLPSGHPTFFLYPWIGYEFQRVAGFPQPSTHISSLPIPSWGCLGDCQVIFSLFFPPLSPPFTTTRIRRVFLRLCGRSTGGRLGVCFFPSSRPNPRLRFTPDDQPPHLVHRPLSFFLTAPPPALTVPAFPVLSALSARFHFFVRFHPTPVFVWSPFFPVKTSVMFLIRYGKSVSSFAFLVE